MKIKTQILALMFLTFLASCVQFSEGGEISDPHTGLKGYHSGEFDMSAEMANFVSGEILYTNGYYGVRASVSRPTTHPIRIERAMSFGRELHISARNIDFSCGGQSCTVTEYFTLLLAVTDIYSGATNGMEIKVLGQDGSFLMKIPKEAFQSMIAVMAK